jgi:hypothetical protein
VAAAAASRWRFTFRRWLDVDLQSQMGELSNFLYTVALATGTDKPIWKWPKKRSIQS